MTRPVNFSKLPLRYYFRVKNPVGETDLILAETKWQAHVKMAEKDGYKYNLSKYTSKKAA